MELLKRSGIYAGFRVNINWQKKQQLINKRYYDKIKKQKTNKQLKVRAKNKIAKQSRKLNRC